MFLLHKRYLRVVCVRRNGPRPVGGRVSPTSHGPSSAARRANGEIRAKRYLAWKAIIFDGGFDWNERGRFPHVQRAGLLMPTRGLGGLNRDPHDEVLNPIVRFDPSRRETDRSCGRFSGICHGNYLSSRASVSFPYRP